MKKNSFKSAFSELYLISPVVYKAVLENIKNSGQGDLQELEKLNKNFLTDEGKPVLEQATESSTQIQSPNTTSIGTQQSSDSDIIETQTNPNHIANSQTTPIVDNFSQATQTVQDQNTQMTQTDNNQYAQSTQTLPLNTTSVSSQTTPNAENFSKEIQTTQPNYVTNSSQTMPDVQHTSQAIQTIPPPIPSVAPPTPSASIAVPLQKETQQIVDTQGSLNDSKKLYKCDYCTTQFTRLFSKQRHTKNIHGITTARKRKSENSAMPQKESKIKKTTPMQKSQIPRPVGGVIALAKNRNAVKRPIGQGDSKIPRLIKRKIFKDQILPKNIDTKLKRKTSNKPLEPEVPVEEKRPDRGAKRKAKDQMKKSTKKRKSFQNW